MLALATRRLGTSQRAKTRLKSQYGALGYGPGGEPTPALLMLREAGGQDYAAELLTIMEIADAA